MSVYVIFDIIISGGETIQTSYVLITHISGPLQCFTIIYHMIRYNQLCIYV